MKTLIAAVVFVFVGMSGAMGNLLSNEGFETGGFDGWTLFTETQDWRTSAWPGDQYSGTYGAVNDVLTTGGDEWRGMYQLITVTEGLSYEYTAYQRAANVESDISESFLELQWFDSAGGLIDQWQATRVVADQAWTLMGSNNLVAPLGAVTASVRAVVHMMGTPVDTDWHVFDDFNFQQSIPEPSTVVLVGGGMLFCLLRGARRIRRG